MDYERIERAMEPNNKRGKQVRLRARHDIGKIVADIVLERARLVDVAKKCKTTPAAVQRFKNRFITDAVIKTVHVENEQNVRKQTDDEFNDLQDDVQKGITDVLREQKILYQRVNDLAADNDNLLDALQPLMQLLRDQTKTYEAIAKTYSQLKDKTTVVLSLNEHPEAAKLMEALYVVFQAHPEAFATFKRVIMDKSIALKV